MISGAIAFLGGAFIGMIKSFSLLDEIRHPVFDGWKRKGIIIYAITVILAWWSIFVWLISQLIKA